MLTGDVTLVDDDGRLLASLGGLRLKRARWDALVKGAQSDEWLYEVRWQPVERLAAEAVASTSITVSDVAGRVDAIADSLAIEHDLGTYHQLIGELETLSLTYVVCALAELGWHPEPGDVVVERELGERLGVVPRYGRLLRRLLAMLAEEGVLADAGTGWIVVRRPLANAPEARVAAIRAEYPAFDGEVTLLDRCARALASVLRGERDPVQLLFPEGSLADVEKLTQGSPAARAYNALVQRVVASAVATAGGRRLRCLEIGAGTGGTTASILVELPADRTEYVFTDISPLFLSRAEKKFAGYPFIKYQTLDIERDPRGQGFEPQGFDIVVAANVLHATADVRRAVAHARELLAPGGLLILLEGTGPQRWVDLTFGLTDGWWKFSDVALRPSHPLLSRGRWVDVLESSGLVEVAALPRAGDGGLFCRQAVMVAKRVSVDSLGARAEAGDWLVIGDGNGLGDAVEAVLDRRGIGVVRVDRAERFAVTGERRYAIDPASGADFDRLMVLLGKEKRTSIARIVHLMALDTASGEPAGVEELERDVETSLRSGLNLVRALATAEFPAKPRVWIVTRESQSVGTPSQEALTLSQAPVWGLGRTAAAEHPEIWGGLVDVDAGEPSAVADALVATVTDGGSEDQVALRKGQRFVARLARSDRPASGGSLELRPDATYLVAGGTGGMGTKVAQWLIDRGARHLVLTGRTGTRRMITAEREALERSGAETIVREADSSSTHDVARVLAEIHRDMPPLRGVIHVAGIFDDRVLLRQDWERFRRVLAPKVRGSFILHHLTRAMPLDFFVVFSSGASFLAPVGLGNYAAGNAFLDSLAHHRRRLGLPAVSIGWGPWKKTGMAEAVGDRRESQWTQAGFSTMTPEQGLEMLERLVRGSSAPNCGPER